MPIQTPTSPGSVLSCPLNEESIDIFADGFVEIRNSDPDVLCTLTEITSEGFLKPVCRSYNARDWEASAGDYSETKAPGCFEGVCNVSLPLLPASSRFQLTSFKTPPYSRKDEIARFLEQATFGPSLDEIEKFDTSNLHLSFANWVKDQQTMVPLTSHREYYRRRMNARYEFASPVGAVTHPCEQGTRYRRYLFSSKDYEKVVTLQKAGNFINVYLDGFLRSTFAGTVVSVTGRVPFPDGR
jgi:hypothetical protein